MQKKEWKSPEISVLGISNTKEDNDNEKIIWGCQYCSKRFWFKKERAEHELICPSKPVIPVPPVPPVPNPTFS